MPQMRPAFVLLASLASSGCVVSFDGYELGASSDASTGGSGNAGTGGSVGGNGGSVGGTSGVGGSLGGGGGIAGGGGTGGVGADGGTGGVVTGGGGASGSGGSTGGNGGTTGGGTGGGTGGSAPTCPSQGGPMTAVPQVGGGSYCVDNTEVTQQQYQAFLATSPNSLTQITECTGQSFTPSGSCNGWNPGSFGQRPAVCVDWCDAYGFCKYVGKHLCGAIDTGDPVTTAQATNEAIDEWYNACSAGGTQLYPYGNLYDGSKCNGLNAGLTNPANALFFAACVGGYTGLNDMSGNVREWTNSCTGSSNCLQRGGSWLDGSNNLTCTATTSGPRMEVNDRIGFRCCAKAN